MFVSFDADSFVCIGLLIYSVSASASYRVPASLLTRVRRAMRAAGHGPSKEGISHGDASRT